MNIQEELHHGKPWRLPGRDDVEMLEDLIVAATNEAFHQMEAESSAVMSELTGGLGNLGGLSF